MKIILGKEAHDQIMYYVNKTDFEISGLGAVEIIEGVPTVTKIYLVDQENHATQTEMSGEAIAKLMYEHHQSGHPGELKFWWHSHVNMGVFWSSTDMTTIWELTEHGWFIHCVFNKKNEYRMAYSSNEPFKIFADDLDMFIDESLASPAMLRIYKQQEKLNAKLFGDCDKSYKKHIKEVPYILPAWDMGFGNQMGLYDTHDKKTSRFNDSSERELREIGTEINEDPDGYWELSSEGYSDDEITYFNSQGIFNLKDKKAFEKDGGNTWWKGQ